MPSTYEHCVKIHEGCGGIVRWVEAIDRPAVGYYGHCTRCDDEGIPVEHMLPLDFLTHTEALDMDAAAFRELSWDDDADFDANQRRLQAVLSPPPSSV
jgi:hypothetical protein